MFWSGYDADTYERLLTDVGFSLVEADVIPQMEGEVKVRFLWVAAQADGGGHS